MTRAALLLCTLLSAAVLRASPIRVLHIQDSITVFDPASAQWHRSYAIQFDALPASGIVFSEFLDWFEVLDHAEVRLSDPRGKVLASASRKDLISGQINTPYALFQDGRSYFLRSTEILPPFLLEATMTIKLQGLAFLPTWRPYLDADWPVHTACYTLVHPKDLPVRHRLTQAIPARVQQSPGLLRLLADSLPALPAEAAALPWAQRSAAAYLCLERFSISGVDGSARSWQDIGRWVAKLLEGQDKLPPALASTAQAIRAAHPQPIDRASAVYAHLQGSKRYVSIQKGMGSWQPAPVADVEAKGYGDCKALSLYTAAMLRAAGVEAHCALITAGDDAFSAVDPAFPSLHFNHMILCIPGPDTTWLECTSSDAPFGHLGPFTEGRHALLITAQGGVLTRTPLTAQHHNTRNRQILLTLAEDLSPSGSITTHTTGSTADELSQLRALSATQRDQRLSKTLGSAGYMLRNSSFPDAPAQQYSLQVQSSRPLQLLGTRLKLTLNPFFESPFPPTQSTPRSSAFIQQGPLRYCDTIRHQLPPKWASSLPPATSEVPSPFGTFQQSISMSGTTLLIVQQLTLERGVWPPSKWPEYMDFAKKVKAEAGKSVLLTSQN